MTAHTRRSRDTNTTSDAWLPTAGARVPAPRRTIGPGRGLRAAAVAVLIVATILAGLVLPRAAGASSETAFTISGRGWGHGVGMSQWGAYGLAARGATYRQILQHYYTGVGFGQIDDAELRVLLGRGLAAVKVSSPSGLSVSAGGAATDVPAGVTATVTYAGGVYRVAAGGWTDEYAVPVTLAPPGGRLSVLTRTDAGVSGPHRGSVRVTAAADGTLAMVNHVGLEAYLRGVVPYEMSASWPAAALKAQSCAARAYAERARRAAGGGGTFDLFCDQRSQVYGGTAREDARSDAAVKATAAVVPVSGGVPIEAVFCSSSGGQTENVELVWQTSPFPYLVSVADPYDEVAPLHAWGPLRRTRAQLEAALGASVQGCLQAVYRVARGVSPRIVKAAIIGSEGTTYLHGTTLAAKLGLYSSWATIKGVSISPAAADKVAVRQGATVTLEGRICPALAAGATITLHAQATGGPWRRRTIVTSRVTETLPDGYTVSFSSYRISVRPLQNTRYYVKSGSAASPTTKVAVRR